MHYANGRPAKVGDMVRGKGYNVKHEVVGMLIAAQPENSACNCTVACVTTASTIVSRGWRANTQNGDQKVGDLVFPQILEADGSSRVGLSAVEATIEYGQLDAFVAIDPLSGAILPESDDIPIPAADPTIAEQLKSLRVVNHGETKAE